MINSAKRSLISLEIDAIWPSFPVPSHHRQPMAIAMRGREIERIAAPVRDLFDLLQHGEVFEANGHPVMRSSDNPDEWVEIAPMLDGWIDCLACLAPDLQSRALRQLSRYLQAGMPIPPSLVASCRTEFEQQSLRVVQAKASEVRDATLRAQIAWEFEKINMEKAA